MVRLWRNGSSTDFVTLCDELERAGQLKDVGGTSYIVQLINSTPTAVHAEHYAGIVAREYANRQLIKAASQIVVLAYDAGVEIGAKQTQARLLVEEAARGTSRQWRGTVMGSELPERALAQLEALRRAHTSRAW